MNEKTLLLRQVNPHFVQQGRMTSQVFQPTPKDDGLLSVYDGDLIAPSEAWNHFVLQGFASVGVAAVSCAECAAESLPFRSDPAPFPEHAVVDFTGLSKGQIEKKAKRLRSYAETRGWLHRA